MSKIQNEQDQVRDLIYKNKTEQYWAKPRIRLSKTKNKTEQDQEQNQD